MQGMAQEKQEHAGAGIDGQAEGEITWLRPSLWDHRQHNSGTEIPL